MYKECKSGLSLERSTPTTMKKYYQLVLLIVAVVSTVCALYYRHQYIRIHNVMEILNFFGKPGQMASTSECAVLNLTRRDQNVLSFADSMPSWQRICDKHFAYSAFWEQIDHQQQVKVVSVGTGGDSDMNFKCLVWFEGKKEPVEGKFGFTLLDIKENTKIDVKELNTGNVNAYYLFCKTQDSGVPYGTAFYKTDDVVPSEPFIPVQPVEKRPMLENSTAVCIAPHLVPALQNSLVFEFLSYHQLVGVNNFVVYDKGLPRMVLRVLQNSTLWKHFNITLTVLPWNFPYPLTESSVPIKLAVEKDCIMRTSGKIRNVAVLAWNEFIVPRLHRSVAVMLDDFDAGRKTTARFSIPTVTFCLEVADDPHAEISSPLILRKTAYSKPSALDRPLPVYRPLLISGDKVLALTTQSMSQGIAAVHRYTHCSRNDIQNPQVVEENMPRDTATFRFSEDLKKSRLLRTWFANKLLL